MNKWYKGDGETLFCITNKDVEYGIKAYGFSFTGHWVNERWGWKLGKREATKEEVESALIKEAERRYKGKRALCLHECDDLTGIDVEWEYSLNDNCLRYTPKNGGCGCVFDKGKWAEIVEEAKPESMRSGCTILTDMPTPKPTITVLDSDRKELGKIYRTNNKYYLHIGNEIIECSGVEDCLIKTDNFYA